MTANFNRILREPCAQTEAQQQAAAAKAERQAKLTEEARAAREQAAREIAAKEKAEREKARRDAEAAREKAVVAVRETLGRYHGGRIVPEAPAKEESPSTEKQERRR